MDKTSLYTSSGSLFVRMSQDAFCRLSNDSQRHITQRIDVDGAAYRLHGQKLAGIVFNREWNNVGETESAAAAGSNIAIEHTY